MTKQLSTRRRVMNGHIGSYELLELFDWLLTDETERKSAVFNWTSGLARQFGYVIENYYKQVKKPDYPKYEEIFSTDPFMCLDCLKEQLERKKRWRKQGNIKSQKNKN